MEDSTGVHMITDTVVCARDGGLSRSTHDYRYCSLCKRWRTQQGMEDSTVVHMITDTVVCARDGGLSKGWRTQQ